MYTLLQLVVLDFNKIFQHKRDSKELNVGNLEKFLLKFLNIKYKLAYKII
jgi:hypothetical protein